MPPTDLRSALERLIAGESSEADLQELQRALGDGRISLASGDRSVATGGNIQDSIVITGDNVSLGLPPEAVELLVARLSSRLTPAFRQYDFFISYCGLEDEDRKWAEWIDYFLKGAGNRVIIQRWDFLGGESVTREMRAALQNSNQIIGLLSHASQRSKEVREIWDSAMEETRTEDNGRLTLVRIDDVQREASLGSLPFLDLHGLDGSQSKQVLEEGLLKVSLGLRQVSFPGRRAESAITEQPSFPRTLPPIWNVPYHRNRFFTGRENIIQEVHKRFASGDRRYDVQALWGLGGVGKSQIALEYAYRYVGDYDLVWWVRAEEPDTTRSDFTALADRINLQATIQERRDLVRQWLEGRTRWLLVFDNVPNPDAVRLYIPQGSGGHVLITSRYQEWRGMASPMELREWSHEESIQFLTRRTGIDTDQGADQLAESLGNLPLALAQVGAYLDETDVPFKTFIEGFQRRRKDILARGGLQHTSATVATTWDLAFEALEGESPAAFDLLRLCAYLAPDAISLPMITQAANTLPKELSQVVRDPLGIFDLTFVLRRYSLVTLVGETLTVHRLVQEATRKRLSREEEHLWVETALKIVDMAFSAAQDFDRVNLRTHVEAVREQAERLQVAANRVVSLTNKARMPFTRRDWEEIRTAMFADPARYGLPERVEGSAVVGSFNIRKLGSMEQRSKEVWQFLADTCRQFDLLAIQEIIGDLSGLKYLMELLGSDFEMIISGVTGSTPAYRSIGERLGFIYNRHIVEQREIVSQIAPDRAELIDVLARNRETLWPALEEYGQYLEALDQWESSGKRGKRPRQGRVRIPFFLSFLRKPFGVSFRFKGDTRTKPMEFLAIDTHLIFGDYRSDRNLEFEALLQWILEMVQENRNDYENNILLLGQLILGLGHQGSQGSNVRDKVKSIDRETGDEISIYFPFLEIHPGETDVFRTNARMKDTFDQIALFTRDQRFPSAVDHPRMGRLPQGPDYGFFKFAELFSEVTTTRPYKDLSLEEKRDLGRKFEFSVSDHMPLWLRLPLP